MHTLKRFLAVVLALAFLVLLPLALFAIAVQTLLLSPDYYKQQLVKIDSYSTAYEELVPALAESIELPEGLPLTKQEVSAIIRRIVPESFVRAQTEKAIDEFFAVVTSEKDTLQIIIPLTEIKQRIPDEVVSLLDKKLDALPACSESAPGLSGQLPGLLVQPPGSSVQPGGLAAFPTCLPPGPDGERFRSEARTLVTAELREKSSSLPDSLDLTEQLTERAGGMERLRANLEGPRRLASDFVLGVEVFGALVFIVLIMVGVLGGDSFNSGVGWIGVTLLIGGATVLLTTLFIVLTRSEAIAGFVQVRGTPRELASVVSPLIASILSDLVRRVQIEAGGVTLLGIVLFYLSRII